jgi:hypothetical protein
MDDEAFGCGSHVVERIAGHKRESGPADIPENGSFVRIDSLRRFDDILIESSRCGDSDQIAPMYFAEMPEEGIPMSGQRGVAGSSGKRGPGNMADCAPQSPAVRAFHVDRRKADGGNFESSHRLCPGGNGGIDRRGARRRSERLRKLPVEVSLSSPPFRGTAQVNRQRNNCRSPENAFEPLPQARAPFPPGVRDSRAAFVRSHF